MNTCTAFTGNKGERNFIYYIPQSNGSSSVGRASDERRHIGSAPAGLCIQGMMAPKQTIPVHLATTSECRVGCGMIGSKQVTPLAKAPLTLNVSLIKFKYIISLHCTAYCKLSKSSSRT